MSERSNINIIKIINKVELLWGVLGLLFIFYPRSVSFYSYFEVQYEYLLYSSCYFFIWFCLIYKRRLTTKQDRIVSWRWMDLLFVLLMLYLFTCTCMNFKENGFTILQLGIATLGYYCFRNIPKEHIMWYIVSFLMGGGIQVVYSLYTQADYFLLSEKWSRIYGSFLNTSVWGNYLALLLMISLGLLMWVKKWNVLLLLPLYVSLIILLWQSDSRTGWLATLMGMIGGIYWVCRWARRNPLKKSHQLLVVLFGGILMTGLCYGLYMYKKDSGNGRLLVWSVSYKMVKDAPLQGHGINGFRQNYMPYQASFLKKYPLHKWRMLADDNSFAFNEYIKFIVEHGVVSGFFFFSVFLYVLLRRTATKEPRIIFFKLVFLGWGIIAFFSYPFFIWQFVVILLFLIAGMGGGDVMRISFYRNSFVCKAVNIGLMGWIVIMLTTGILYGKNPQSLLNRGIDLYVAKRYNEAKNVLECSFMHYPNYNTAMMIGEAYRELQKNDSAEYYWRAASDMIPYRVMPHFYLFKLYQSSDVNKAYLEAVQIKNIPVKVYAPQLNILYKEVDNFLQHY